MSASMHPTIHCRGVGRPRRFLQGQGIHVGPETDRRTGLPPVDQRDHARGRDPGLDPGDPERPQPVDHEGRRGVAIETDLRMGVQVASPPGHLLFHGGDGIQNGHGVFLVGRAP